MTERRHWSSQQDKILKFLRQEQKIKKWSEIARIMESSYQIIGRNQKQCRQRYQNHLDSNIINEKLSQEEEKLLLKLHDQHGNKWSLISNKFPRRTDNSLKNHFHSKLRAAIRKINRYLGCKKKKGAKIYSLSIVYDIVKYFGQNSRRDQVDQDNANIMNVLKNSLLKFAGAKVESIEIDWDQNNEKKMAERIIFLLKKFQQMPRSLQRLMIACISEEQNTQNKENKVYKTQETLPYNSDKNQFQLFRGFRDNHIPETNNSQKQAKNRSQKPKNINSNSSCKSFEKVALFQEHELQFEKLEILKKTSEAVSQIRSDAKKLIEQKITLSTQNLLRMQKVASLGSKSIQFLQQNELRRKDSVNSRGSNIWTKELGLQSKLDFCIFQ